MIELDERFKAAEEKMKNPSFLNNKGLGNETGYYIFDYPPEQEPVVRERIDLFVKNYNLSDTDRQIVVFDLYDIMIKLLDEKGFNKKNFELEKKGGLRRVTDAINHALCPADKTNLIVNYINKSVPEKSIIFIVGVGKCFPVIRAHNVLNNLHPISDDIPIVVFYPGKFTGQELILFNKIKDENYYRAFRLA